MNDALSAAFPSELADDARAVLAVMPAPSHLSTFPFSVVVQDQRVAIPGRIYHDEPSADVVASLSSSQLQLLHCLYTRHCDGRVRQRHLEKVVGSVDPWVVPFVVQLVGEYVLEIVCVIRDELLDLAAPDTLGHLTYGRFLADNPAYFARIERRVVSYWNCYHRRAYVSFRGYPGCTALDVLRSAAADHAGHPFPNFAPRARSGVDGYC
ncbi:hypothetical protein G6045_24250 [Streptomyces sp. YC504]|uniref:Uncharacterized protein n=1 Tax=Streptomyces mesophilus TaxID=1775132 RepID=A0A6G4XME5_9ACTN|nr:hypothetical protein [Streptomyces mesophilus]NGO78746.1 hypothetical protein [Streptomyces mesophilus]